jgi:hypothetical protein
MMPVARRMREVRAARYASGTTPSVPHASDDQTVSTPSRSASTTWRAVWANSGESLHTKSASVIAVCIRFP